MRNPYGKLFAFCITFLVGSQSLQAAEFGPHSLVLDVTPLVQWTPRQGDTSANAEFDVIGSFRLGESETGAFGGTWLDFWVLGNATLGGTVSANDFSQRAGLLWDTSDGDAPETSWILAVGALRQELHTGFGEVTLKFGKLYPGSELAASDYYGDDRGTFFSQMLASDVAGRWYDLIGIGASVTVEAGPWYGGALVVDATAQADLLDFKSLRDGAFMAAVELGRVFDIGGRETRVSMIPYHVDATPGLSTERGLVLSFQHDLVQAASEGPADIVLFGRYTFRDGGTPRNRDGQDQAKPVRRGGFLGMAFNSPFGRDEQQVGLAVMQGTPTDAMRAQGFGTQSGIEVFWKYTLNPNAEFSVDLQALNKGHGDIEYVPGIRLKLRI